MIVIGALAAPTVAALAVLWLAGYLPAAAALLAALAVVAALTILATPRLRQFRTLAAAIGELAHRDQASLSESIGDPPLDELARMVGAAARERDRRRDQLEMTIAANEAVFARLPDPLIMIDRERRIVRANPAAAELFDSPLAGRDLVGVLRNPAVVEAVGEALAERSGRQVEFVLPVPIERSFAARIEPLSAATADGSVALLTLHDLTAMKRADRLRADFVANASHELRTPLATLLGFIETLRGPARDDTAARERFLAIMDGQTQRMARLVADLLSLSRIEMNEHRQPTEAIDAGRILLTVVDSLQMKAAEKNMRIVIDGTVREPLAGGTVQAVASLPAVIGDGDELAQVFQNLLDNAIKYGRAVSTIRVTGWAFASPSEHRDGGAPMPALRLDGAAIAMSIEDEGDGIAREHLPRLTERFYRVDTARSRELGGTGLGLAIVKHILSRHRGWLDIDSEPGIGSRFTVYLPVADPADPRQ
jgi:two-component system phosphate regulon sensor histidine kinase PhoR